jgi:hypothetical protein
LVLSDKAQAVRLSEVCGRCSLFLGSIALTAEESVCNVADLSIGRQLEPVGKLAERRLESFSSVETQVKQRHLAVESVALSLSDHQRVPGVLVEALRLLGGDVGGAELVAQCCGLLVGEGRLATEPVPLSGDGCELGLYFGPPCAFPSKIVSQQRDLFLQLDDAAGDPVVLLGLCTLGERLRLERLFELQRAENEV